MWTYYQKKRKSFGYSVFSCILSVYFAFCTILPPSFSQSLPAGQAGISLLNLPVPGAMVPPSPAFVPVLLKGMTIHPNEPFRFNFIVDSGHSDKSQEEIEKESEKLVRYFLAAMTTPKDDLWVNLSPYEPDRIIPEELGKTALGRDLLAQDYLLKQLTASLMYPEEELGEKFWARVYERAEKEYGVTEIPVNTFNKVWIMPESATVYEHENTVYIVNSRLKVMLEEDYEALNNNNSNAEPRATFGEDQLRGDSTEIIREIILPEIEREVNEGQNFASLRQMYHSLILAKWYKETIKGSILFQVYVDQNKVAGVAIEDKTVNNQIYDRYMQAFKTGVFDYIKEEYDTLSQEVIPRKYFSGGFKDAAMRFTPAFNPTQIENSIVGATFDFAMSVTPKKDEVDASTMTFEEKIKKGYVKSKNVFEGSKELLDIIDKKLASHNEKRALFIRIAGLSGTGKKTFIKTFVEDILLKRFFKKDIIYSLTDNSVAGEGYEIFLNDRDAPFNKIVKTEMWDRKIAFFVGVETSAYLNNNIEPDVEVLFHVNEETRQERLRKRAEQNRKVVLMVEGSTFSSKTYEKLNSEIPQLGKDLIINNTEEIDWDDLGKYFDKAMVRKKEEENAPEMSLRETIMRDMVYELDRTSHLYGGVAISLKMLPFGGVSKEKKKELLKHYLNVATEIAKAFSKVVKLEASVSETFIGLKFGGFWGGLRNFSDYNGVKYYKGQIREWLMREIELESAETIDVEVVEVQNYTRFVINGVELFPLISPTAITHMRNDNCSDATCIATLSPNVSRDIVLESGSQVFIFLPGDVRELKKTTSFKEAKKILQDTKFKSNAGFSKLGKSGSLNTLPEDVRVPYIESTHKELLRLGETKEFITMVNTSRVQNQEEAIIMAALGVQLVQTPYLKLEIRDDNLMTKNNDIIDAVKVLVNLNKDIKIFPLIGKTMSKKMLNEILELKQVVGLRIEGTQPGSGGGLGTEEGKKLIKNIMIWSRGIRPDIQLIAEAGISSPEHAQEAMEMGFNAVLVNAAITQSKKPAEFSREFADAVLKGRESWLSNHIFKEDKDDVDDSMVGGIDMNEIDLNRGGSGVDIQFDPAQLEPLLEDGVVFSPVFMDFTPINSILPLLGLVPRNEENEEYNVSRLN